MAWAAEMIGPLTEGMASAAQYKASKHERNVAWRRMQAWEVMAPSLKMEGLRRAGVNPLLPFMGGGGGGGSSHGTVPPMASPGQKPNFSYNVQRVVSSAKQMAAMDAEVGRLEAERRIADMDARIKARETDIMEKFGEESARVDLLMKYEHWKNLEAERSFTVARRGEAEAVRARLDVDKLLMELGIPGARAMEELYEKYPMLRQIREFGGTLPGGSAALGGLAGWLAGRGADRAKQQMEAFGRIRPFGPAPKGSPSRPVRKFGPAPGGHKPKRR